MKMIYFFLLCAASAVCADDSPLRVLNNWINRGDLVEVDCYIPLSTSEAKTNEEINEFLERNTLLITIKDNKLLKEVGKMLDLGKFERRKNYVLPAQRNYCLYTFKFSSSPDLVLYGSSSFGKDQFCFCDLNIKGNEMKFSGKRFLYESENELVELCISLPGFRESSFYAAVIDAKGK